MFNGGVFLCEELEENRAAQKLESRTSRSDSSRTLGQTVFRGQDGIRSRKPEHELPRQHGLQAIQAGHGSLTEKIRA